MNRSYIDDHHVVARYLADQLSESERLAFEAYFLEHPEMVQEIEQAAQLKAGLRQLQDSGELEQLKKAQPGRGNFLMRALRRNTRTTAIAAVALVAIVSALWLKPGMSSGPWLAAAATSLTGSLGEPLPMGGSYTILRTRGSEADVDIELPRSAQALTLRILPEGAVPAGPYRATLYSISGSKAPQQVATLGGLAPAEDDFVAMYVDSSKLLPGQYRLVLSSPANPASAFQVRVH